MCTSVRTLTLRDLPAICGISAEGPQFPAIVAHFPHVTDIQVIRCRDLDCLLRLTGKETEPVATEEQLADRDTRLHSLTVRDSDTVACWTNLPEQTLRSLQSLHISRYASEPVMTPAEDRALRRILHASGGTLSYLLLALSPPEGETPPLGKPRVAIGPISNSLRSATETLLTPCVRLQELAVCRSGLFTTLAFLRTLCGLLAECGSSDLQELTVCIFVIPPDELRNVPWHAFQQACDRQHTLQRVRFILEHTRDKTIEFLNDFATIIEEMLPDLDARDLLDFEYFCVNGGNDED